VLALIGVKPSTRYSQFAALNSFFVNKSCKGLVENSNFEFREGEGMAWGMANASI
jgi:hypothetical protein